MNEELDSAQQDQWKDICAAARANIAKMVPLIPAMQPGEVASLMTAIDTAMTNEALAASYDQFLMMRRACLERASIYGD